MSVVKKISKYCVIFIIGSLLAILMAYIEYDNKDLSASVLSLTEQGFFESTNWDAGYKKENQIFELFLSENVRNQGRLEVSLLFDSSDLFLDLNNITTLYQVEILAENSGNIILGVDGYEKADFVEGIFQIPYVGDSKEINLEYVKSENLIYSIGNLDNIENKENH